ncbi:MAG: YqaA family protein [Kangiellaceae bacterium]|jgi:membrane protein YqaA with SNARE-associated domain
MKIFSPMYESCLKWAKHKHAVYYLGIMSFFESIIFPIPVDVMLAPMCLSRLDKAWHYAFVATTTSVLGGVVGYFLGVYLGAAVVEPFLVEWGFGDAYLKTQIWFEKYGVLMVFIAGFAPIPYKVFTVSAGALSISPLGDLTPFIIASVFGRAGRFYLVAFILRLGGEKMEKKLHQMIDYIGWGIVIVAFLGYLMYKYSQ